MLNFSEYEFGLMEIFYLIILFVISFLITYFIIPFVIKFTRSKGWVGIDIHKIDKPEVAESGGISIVIGLCISLIIMLVMFPKIINEILVILLTIVCAAIIGLIDDRKKLSSIKKIILTIIIGGPIFILNFSNFINVDSPTIPILGMLRLNFIYPLVLPVIIAVTTNTVNMLEGYNGEGSGTCLIAVIFMFLAGLIWNSAQAVIYSVPFIAILLAFFLYNKYPAKTFPGDVGTLTIGAMIGCIAIFGSIEVPTFCTLLCHVFNSFYVLSSLRRLLESSQIQQKQNDIIFLENGKIKASREDDAAMTLPRLILAKGELTEPELVNNFFALSLICGQFAIIAALSMQWTLYYDNIAFLIISGIIFILICGGFSLIIYWKFPRIRGISIIMVILLVSGIVFVWFIDWFIVQTPFNWLWSGLLTAVGLGLWYYVGCLRYFWKQIDKMKKREDKENI